MSACKQQGRDNWWRQADRQTEVEATGRDRGTHRQTDRQTEAERTGGDRQTDRRTDGRTERQTDRETDRPCALATARNTSINRLGRCDVVAPTSFLATTTNTHSLMHRT